MPPPPKFPSAVVKGLHKSQASTLVTSIQPYPYLCLWLICYLMSFPPHSSVSICLCAYFGAERIQLKILFLYGQSYWFARIPIFFLTSWLVLYCLCCSLRLTWFNCLKYWDAQICICVFYSVFLILEFYSMVDGRSEF